AALVAEQKSADHGGALLRFVQRDNAETDELRARNALQSSSAGSGAACSCFSAIAIASPTCSSLGTGACDAYAQAGIRPTTRRCRVSSTCDNSDSTLIAAASTAPVACWVSARQL